jgi:hypothetical protein
MKVGGYTMETTLIKHIRSINKTMTYILVFLALLSIVTGSIYHVPLVFAGAAVEVVVCVLIVISNKKKKYEIQTAYIVIFGVLLSIINVINDAQSFYLVLIPISMSALYFNGTLFKITSISANVLFNSSND